MREYRCYFLNRGGGIGDVVQFVSMSDSAALDTARRHFDGQAIYPSFEIWERARLVHREAAMKAAVRG